MTIRVVYHGAPPDFPATDQHPDAVRYGPIEADGAVYYADAIGGEPDAADIRALLAPPADLTSTEKLAAIGLTREDLLAIINGG